ncbi:MAG: hypothetical protein MMC23_009296 [Stictis urceolatum]|nr:hypothetical protein [Stictis urceolata]
MPVRALIIVHRKPGLTFAEFKHHYETVHVPLLQKIGGSDFPRSHRRMYVQRTEDGDAVLFQGQQSDVKYDCICETTCESQEALQAWIEKVAEPENARLIKEDEEKFLDPSKNVILMLGEVEESGPK